MSDAIPAAAVGIFVGMVFGLGLTFPLGVTFERGGWQQTTVERGLAQYCPLNGEWAWKGECEE